VHKVNIVERNCQQRWPTIPLIPQSEHSPLTSNHWKQKYHNLAMDILVLALDTYKKCGGVKWDPTRSIVSDIAPFTVDFRSLLGWF